MERPETKSELGLHIFVTGYSVKGVLTEEVCSQINKRVADMLRVSIEGLHSSTWQFPAFGCGGIGFTKTQPFMITQGLPVSFLTWDTWKEHDGGYFFVASCELYNGNKIKELLTEKGLLVVQMKAITLSINGVLEEEPP